MNQRLIVVALWAAACGPTKYRVPTMGPYATVEQRCVFPEPVDSWRADRLTPFTCVGFTDRDAFDVVAHQAYYFPDMIGRSGGKRCDGCWLEIVRPPEAGLVMSLLHGQPATLLARYDGQVVDQMMQGEGSLSLFRTEVCARECLDHFMVRGELAAELVLSGRWERGVLQDDDGFTARWRLPDGGRYEGRAVYSPTLGVVPHGEGLLEESSGRRYRGVWVDGRREGFGIATDLEGNTYIGEHLADLRHGEGELTTPRGSRYEGFFEGGRRHGLGRLVRADGSSWRGTWVDDQPQGVGERTAPNGVVIRGTWDGGDVVSEEVEVEWPNGERYAGALKDGQPEGFGVMVWPDGATYRGLWVHGRPSGFGAYTWPDGTRHIGGWLDGRPRGCGVVALVDGALWVGEWERGVVSSTGCTEPLALPDNETFARLEAPVPATELQRVRTSQRYNAAQRRAAEARRADIELRYGRWPAPPTPSATPVLLSFEWPEVRGQRMVHPSCLPEGAITVTLQDAPVEPVVVLGVVDSTVIVHVPPGPTQRVCARVDGPCGRGYGCAPVNTDAATRARLLLEPTD